MKFYIAAFLFAFGALLAFRIGGTHRTTMHADTFDTVQQIDYLWLGSSRTSFDLNQHILSDSLGGSYTLAFNGTTPFFFYFMLKQHCATKPLPRHVRVELALHMLPPPPRIADMNLVASMTAQEKWHFYQYTRGVIPVDTLWKSIFYSDHTRMLFFSAVRPSLAKIRFRGGLRPGRAPLSQEVFDQLPSVMSADTNGLTVHPHHLRAIDSIMAFCKQRGIELRFWEPPYPAVTMQTPAYQKIHISMKNYITSKGYKYIDNSNIKIDSSKAKLFWDKAHTSDAGTNTVSVRLVRWMR